MKKRLGFVSNSSSSSFVLVGVNAKEIDAKEIDAKDIVLNYLKIPIEEVTKVFGDNEIDWNEYLYEYGEIDNFRYLGEEDIFGIMIGEHLEDGLESRSLSEVEVIFNKMQEAGFKKEDIKLYYGERYC